MIQRIQTLYLLLVILLSVLFLAGNIIGFTADNEPAFKISATGVYNMADGNKAEFSEKLLPFSAVSVMIPLIFLAAIFLYKQRRIQIKVILTGILLIIIMIAALMYISSEIVNIDNAEIIPSLKMIYPPAMILFAILAFRAVQKDERLVKSYERLR